MTQSISDDMRRVLRTSGLFDADWYTDRYPDVAMTGLDPLDHYLRYGSLLARPAGPFFDTGRYARRHGLGPEDRPLLHFLREQCGIRPESPERMVARLARRLWGGFSGPARRDLDAFIDAAIAKITAETAAGVTGDSSAPGLGRAAFELARWHMVRQDWRAARARFDQVRRHDKALFQSRECELLYMETCLALQDLSGTDAIIERTHRTDADNALLMLQSNILLQGGVTGSRRLDLMNRIYRRAGLSEIALLDPAGPFFFANLGFRSPDAGTVDGPKVSILMPVYNGGAHLEVAIRSLLTQTWRNLEIVAVDDCSTDDSWQRLERLAATDSRLRIHRSAVNHGAYPSRNMALGMATGDIITVHDSDDWSHPQMIEMQMRGLTEGAGQGAAPRATCSIMARVTDRMKFNLRPQTPRPSLLQRSFPSLMIRRADLAALGEWDTVSAAADSELIQRIMATWGADAVADILPDVPLSFFLTHEASLTQAKGTSLNSLTFGIRQDYARMAQHWRERQRRAAAEARADTESDTGSEPGPLVMKRTGPKHPFPIPMGLAPKSWPRNRAYDLVIISDLAQAQAQPRAEPGDTLRHTTAHIRAARAAGLRVGLFHWPRYDLPPAEIAGDYLDMCYHDGIDLLVPEDAVSARLVLILHPQSLSETLDGVPAIAAEQVVVLADAPLRPLWSMHPLPYDPAAITALSQRLFGRVPQWKAVSERIAKGLRAARDPARSPALGPALGPDDIWPLPFDREVPAGVTSPPYLQSGLQPDQTPDRPIRLGRDVPDHWAAWPARLPALRASHCAGVAGIALYLRGPVTTLARRLAASPDNKADNAAGDAGPGTDNLPANLPDNLPDNWPRNWPRNWHIEDASLRSAADFLQGVDAVLHFPHEDEAPALTYPMLDALAAGRPLILPPRFAPLCGDAAVYCDPAGVAALVRDLCANPAAYARQTAAGLAFLTGYAARNAAMARIGALLAGETLARTEDA
jgi:hypothetical protein